MAYPRMFSFDGTSHLCCILRHPICLAYIEPLSGFISAPAFGMTQQKRQFLNLLNCPGAPTTPL